MSKAMTDKPEVVAWLFDDGEVTLERDYKYVGVCRPKAQGKALLFLADHEKSRAADKARIAELSDLLLDAKADIQEWLKSFPDANEEPSYRIITRIDAALAQQGKEGGE